MKQNAVIYQGLFLIAFALYAKEQNESHPIVIQKETVIAQPEITPTRPESQTLSALYQELKSKEVFQTPVDGVKLTQLGTAIQVSLQSDELYRDGEAAIEETWYPMIDQIGSALFPRVDQSFKVSFVGYANSLNERESRSAAFQQSPYLFSASRAEWLFRYYDSHFHLKSEQRSFYMTGAGAVPNGKRVEIWIEE